jgi:endonuclease YncB( thermonuclease family)
MRAQAVGALTLLLICSIAEAEDITGAVRIVDGDTVVVGSTKVRLEGIDAPETDQVCLDTNGARWTCGIEARDQLKAYIGDRQVSCSLGGVDVYRRTLSVCRVAGQDINAWMVSEGWALPYVKYSSKYVQAGEEARARRRGMWQGAFIAPWDWRHRNNHTVVLGSASIPISAQAALLDPALAAGAPTSQCVIKGNVNRNGERIFHLPNQQYYGRVKMDIGNGKRWFCTPEEAEAAGWRPALR